MNCSIGCNCHNAYMYNFLVFVRICLFLFCFVRLEEMAKVACLFFYILLQAFHYMYFNINFIQPKILQSCQFFKTECILVYNTQMTNKHSFPEKFYLLIKLYSSLFHWPNTHSLGHLDLSLWRLWTLNEKKLQIYLLRLGFQNRIQRRLTLNLDDWG